MEDEAIRRCVHRLWQEIPPGERTASRADAFAFDVSKGILVTPSIDAERLVFECVVAEMQRDQAEHQSS